MTLEELEATTSGQPMTADQAAIILLQCICPLLAQSGHSLQCNAMSAFGGKADIRQIGSAVADSACDRFKYVIPHPEQTRIRIAQL